MHGPFSKILGARAHSSPVSTPLVVPIPSADIQLHNRLNHMLSPSISAFIYKVSSVKFDYLMTITL